MPARKPVNSYLLDAFVTRGSRLSRTDAALMNKAARLLQDLTDELSSTLAGINFDTGTTTAKLARLEKLKTRIDKIIDGSYSDLSDLTDENGMLLATNEIDWVVKTINGAIGIDIMDVSINKLLIKQLATDVMIQGAPSSAWWYKQGKDLQHKFMAEMRMGVMQGENLNDLVRRVRGRQENKFRDGIMSASTRNAEALVRTSQATVLSNVRNEIYSQNEDILQGVQSHATLDFRTTPVCQAYDGATYDLNDNPINGTTLPYLEIPRHWG